MRRRIPPPLSSAFRHPHHTHSSSPSIPPLSQSLRLHTPLRLSPARLQPPIIQNHNNSVHHTQNPKHRQTQKPPSTHELPNGHCSNFFSYGHMVQRYVGSCNPHDAQNLHLWLIKSGFEGDRFLSNNLINIYAKTGDLGVARRVFDEMPERNMVSWTCLISGFAQRGHSDDACNLFRSMISEEVSPTQFTFGSVLQACQMLGADGLGLGTQIHALVWKTGHAFDSVVCNSLMSMYGGCSLGSTYDALEVFQRTPKMHLISWNSAISVCSRRGDVMSALELFSAMQNEGDWFCLRPNEYTFGSLLSATYSCSSFSSYSFHLQFLDQMLSQVIKSGFLNDLYVGSALVSAFARFGVLDKAKEIFLQMPIRNVVSMNGLMVGLVKQKCGEEAVDVFRAISGSIVINDDCYAVFLSACAEFLFAEEGRRKGREIHGLVIRSGGLGNHRIAVGNGLVNMYAKCGAIDEARRVFELMDVRDQVSWNSIISGLDQNGCFEEALMIFRNMQRSDVAPSNFALISTLSACASLQFLRLGNQVHCDAIKLGLSFDISVSNSLLALYGECGCMSECWKVFHGMPNYDLVSWNSMIGALADMGASTSETVGALLDMMRNGWMPNRVTFINILTSLSSLSVLELSAQIHTLVQKCGLSDECALENALLSCYAKCGQMDSCQRIFSNMSSRRDNVSWNSMVAGYIHNELFSEVLDFIWFMMHSGQKIDCFTLSTVISACASLAALERGMELHAFGMRSLLGSDIVLDSSLVDMYSKCGRVDYASKIFMFMPLKNEFTWNSMISGYARHGHAEKALEIFENMQSQEHNPDHITFVGVLSACSHVGLVKEGLEHFESMSKKYGLIPRMEHYSCMVDLLGRAGKLDKVEDFLKKMPVTPNALVLRTVLGACCRVKDGSSTAMGKWAGEMLLELEPQNPVNYLLLSHMYAARERWEDVAKARAGMRATPVRKEAGCSWVTLKDGVHVFIAGDRSHPETEAIYAKLRELNQRIRDAGYAPQTDFALYDLETENKEELLSYHSEKIAVAFVLTRSSGLPIRIIKNLRVCGDCHLAFVYISKVVGRKIILRDSNRFHHFEDGKCSCRDYW